MRPSVPLPFMLVIIVGATPLLCCPVVADTADSDGAEQTYLSANGLLNRGLYQLAAAEYRKFLAEHADHGKAPVARYGLAVCCFRTGDHEGALTELKQLASREGFAYAAEVGAMLGQCRLARQEYGEAAAAFAHVVGKHVKHALADDAAALCVEALYLDGQHGQTVEWCQAFAKRWPKSALRERVDYFWALAHTAGGSYRAAAECLEHLLAHYPQSPFADHAGLLLAQCHHHDNALDKAARWYRQVLDRAESEYTDDALLGLATLVHGQGRVAEAGKLLDRLLERSPAEALAVSAKLQRGRAWFDQQRYDAALKLFEEVREKGADLADDAAYWAAKCMLRQGNFDEAARRLSRATEEYPQSNLLPEMHYDRIVALTRLEDDTAAAKAVESFRQRFPKHTLVADALHLAALISHRQKGYDESLEHCRRFLGRYPEHALAPKVRFLAAENEYFARRYEAALEAYEEFARKHPQDPQTLLARYRTGMALYRLGRYDEAAARLGTIAQAELKQAAFRPALLALGDIHFRRGAWKQAEHFLRAYLGDDLDVAAADDALLKLGLAQQRQGRHDQALGIFEQLIERFAESAHRIQARFERGQALVALDRLDEARQALEQVLREASGSRFDVYAHNHLGAIAMRQKRYADAADCFARVGQGRPDEATAAEALYQRGQALLLVEQYAAAEKAFRQLLEQYASHERALQAQAQLAIACARQDRFADALKLIRRVERGGFDKLDQTLRAGVRYEKAWCLRELGKADEAADVYRALLEAPGAKFDFHAALELAELEAAAKRYEPAVQLLQRLSSEADNASARVSSEILEKAAYRLGVCEFELGRTKAAAETLERFVKTFPDSPLFASASFFCGEAYFRDGRQERAATHFANVVERYASDAVYGPSLLRLGESLAALQRWARSEKAFTDYLERQADSEQWFQAQFGIGWARENQGRHNEAIAAYRSVVARHKGPTAARAQFQIGECLFAKKQYEDAARELLKVDILYAYPEWSAAALYEAGRCFEALGKTVEARTQFKAVVDKHKQTRWGELAGKRLAALSANVLPGRSRKP